MNKMILVSLTLINYIRMAQPGITKLVFAPDDQYTLQLILGTNGSGKSSLLWEAFPLPGEQNDFGVGGRKELVYHYKGAEFVLISDFSGSKPQHQFIVDGVDMNDGGKIEMFRSLCEEHFGVTNEIRLLALEKDPLSKMSPNRRRYWMIKLADTDFNYAINVYNNIKKAHRDASGMIDRLNKRLLDETSKVLAKEVVDDMRGEIKDIKTLINDIYGMRNSQTRKLQEVLADVEEMSGLLNRSSDEVERFNFSLLETCGYHSREGMVARREELREQIYGTQQLNHHLFEDHNKIRKKYDNLIKAGTESITELERKREDATDAIAIAESFLVMKNVRFDSDPQQMKDALTQIYADLFERMSNLPANDGYYSSKKAEECENQNLELMPKINATNARIARLKEDIDHKRSHVQADAVECPSCHHKWTSKASEEDIQKAEQLVKNLEQHVEELANQKKANDKYLAEMSEYSASFRMIQSIVRSVPSLSPYFNEIMQNNRLVKYPGSVSVELYSVMSDLDHHIEISKHKKTIAHTTEQIELKKGMDADTIESIEKDMHDIENKMAVQTRKLQDLQNEQNNIGSLIQQFDKITKLNEDLKNNSIKHGEFVTEWINARYQQLLWDVILMVQTTLARKEDALAAATSQQQTVDLIAGQLEEAKMNERVAKAAHIALSPTNGAIAEGLHRFIHTFVSRMNKVVGSIWTYPLEILSPRMEDGQADMDYKFPFQVNKTGKPKKDVEEGSLSQENVFNFSFRICALQQLGLTHLPLFLDEFESSYDDAHRERGIYFIKKLLDEKVYGQIFMVSHYESNHGALSSLAQTCVLSKDNLLLPTNIVYNEHVTIA